MPSTYVCPSRAAGEPFTTTYQVFTGKGALFEDGKGTKIADVTDGTSNTLMVVEAKEAVPWTKPDDLPFDPAAAPSLFGAGSTHPGRLQCALRRWIGAILEDIHQPANVPSLDHARRRRSRQPRQCNDTGLPDLALKNPNAKGALMERIAIRLRRNDDKMGRRIGTISLQLILALAFFVEPVPGQEARPADKGAGAAPLARYVPLKDLLAYLEFDGLDAHADAWRASAAYKLLNDTKLGTVLEDLALQGIEIIQETTPPRTTCHRRRGRRFRQTHRPQWICLGGIKEGPGTLPLRRGAAPR